MCDQVRTVCQYFFFLQIAWDFFLRLMGEVSIGNSDFQDTSANLELLEASERLPPLQESEAPASQLSGLLKLMFKLRDE